MASQTTIEYYLCAHGTSVTVQEKISLAARLLRRDAQPLTAKICQRPACIADAQNWIRRSTGRSSVVTMPQRTQFPQNPSNAPVPTA